MAARRPSAIGASFSTLTDVAQMQHRCSVHQPYDSTESQMSSKTMHYYGRSSESLQKPRGIKVTMHLGRSHLADKMQVEGFFLDRDTIVVALF
jgi:hypothetical protein